MRHLKRKEGRLICSTPRAFCPSPAFQKIALAWPASIHFYRPFTSSHKCRVVDFRDEAFKKERKAVLSAALHVHFCPSLPSRKSPSHGLLPSPFTGPLPFSIMNDGGHGVL
ncbi:hypothetical protein CEXT_246871 [Caerostris extrusa]|uniref:Uncharacterized protein n=1 Tax=Caerostris extrusa TaxID=172846 RepID=A0AAV4WDY9_CAEEX|nr:hypothetical protein CEXT_246871 [Caerostris extrusa]